MSIYPILNTVQVSTWDLSEKSHKLPTPLWSFFTAMHKIHSVWRWYRKVDIYRNPDNFHKLLGGHLLTYVAGDSKWLRIAAHCVLVATRILACVDQVSLLYKTYLNLLKVIKDEQFRYEEWSFAPSSSLLSPSTRFAIHSYWNNQCDRIKKVVAATLMLFRELFKLSMKLMDAAESFTLNPTTQRESVNELFVNLTSTVDSLVNNQDGLCLRLKENENTINSFLTTLGSSYTVKSLVDAVESSISLKVVKGAQRVLHAGDGHVKNFLLTSMENLASSLDLGGIVPMGKKVMGAMDRLF
jgi:hypothetical protein